MKGVFDRLLEERLNHHRRCWIWETKKDVSRIVAKVVHQMTPFEQNKEYKHPGRLNFYSK